MANQLDQYLIYRKNLGYTQMKIKWNLLSFDRYLKKQNVNWNQLQAPFFLRLRRQISTHPNIVNDILSDLRGFFQFLVRKGDLDENPLKDIPRLPKRYFVPFIFSDCYCRLKMDPLSSDNGPGQKLLVLRIGRG